MPTGALNAVDNDQFPSLGGRRPAANSEQSWGSGGCEAKPRGSSDTTGRTPWGSRSAHPLRTERSDEPGRRLQTVPGPSRGHRDNLNSRSNAQHRDNLNSRSNAQGDINKRVCCHFLEEGWCTHAKSCRFKHTQDVDREWTLCGFGSGCKHGHGKALLASSSGGRTRACCHFLEGKCTNGARCKFKHEECDKSLTLCGYGTGCQFGHGSAFLETTDTLGNDNPVRCCHFLEHGRCANGPQCNWKHEKVADTSKVQCGYGVTCKHGHGWACTNEEPQWCPRVSQEGYSSRDAAASARQAKMRETFEQYHTRDDFMEDAKASAQEGSRHTASKDDRTRDGSTKASALGQSTAWGKSAPEDRDGSTKAYMHPDAWDEDMATLPQSSDTDQSVGHQKPLPARDTAAEDIIGALEQAWESVWSPTDKEVPVVSSEDATPVGLESACSDEDTPTSGAATVAAATSAVDGQVLAEKQLPCNAERVSSVDNEPKAPATRIAKREFKDLPSWLVRSSTRRRAQSKARERSCAADDSPERDHKQVLSTAKQDNSSDTEGGQTAASLPESDEKHTMHIEEQVDTNVECEAKRKELQTSIDKETQEEAAHPLPKLSINHEQVASDESNASEDAASPSAGQEAGYEESEQLEDGTHLEQVHTLLDDQAGEIEAGFNRDIGGEGEAKELAGHDAGDEDTGGEEEAKGAAGHDADDEDILQEAEEGTGQVANDEPLLPKQTTWGISQQVASKPNGRMQVACCHFLRGWCQWGASCDYKHELGADPSCAVCEYGENCVHGHGWLAYALQRQTAEHSLQISSYETVTADQSLQHPSSYKTIGWKQSLADTQVQMRKRSLSNDPHKRAFSSDRNHDRACCLFLEYGSCPSGQGCPFKHVLTDPARTKCNYGPAECMHEHGWALRTETSSRRKSSRCRVWDPESGMLRDDDTKTGFAAAEKQNQQAPWEQRDNLTRLPTMTSDADWTEKEDKRNVLKESTDINIVSGDKATKGKACCTFLQHWWCSKGSLCQYSHVKCNRAHTLCGFGTKDCYYRHGWARQLAEKTPIPPTNNFEEAPEQSNVQPVEETPIPVTTDCEETTKQSKVQPDGQDRSEGSDERYAWQTSKFTTKDSGDEQNHESHKRVCCYFLQYWQCANGENCPFKHVKSDQDTTVCGYGRKCRFQHGWAQPFQSSVYIEATDDPDSKVLSNDRVCNRACRNFLDGARGNRRGSPEHNRVRSAERNRGRSTERTQGDRVAWVGGGDAAAGVRIPNAPTKLLRAALTGLLGFWYSVGPDKTQQSHKVTMRVAPGCRGYATLVCLTTSKGEESTMSIKCQGGDIVLGEKGEFFLDASTNRFVTWVSKNRPDVKKLWARGWVDAVAMQNQVDDDMEEVLFTKGTIQFQ